MLCDLGDSELKPDGSYWAWAPQSSLLVVRGVAGRGAWHLKVNGSLENTTLKEAWACTARTSTKSEASNEI